MFGPEHNRRSVDEGVERNHRLYGGVDGYNVSSLTVGREWVGLVRVVGRWLNCSRCGLPKWATDHLD